jgi:hypothetical protein
MPDGSGSSSARAAHVIQTSVVTIPTSPSPGHARHVRATRSPIDTSSPGWIPVDSALVRRARTSCAARRLPHVISSARHLFRTSSLPHVISSTRRFFHATRVPRATGARRHRPARVPRTPPDASMAGALRQVGDPTSCDHTRGPAAEPCRSSRRDGPWTDRMHATSAAGNRSPFPARTSRRCPRSRGRFRDPHPQVHPPEPTRESPRTQFRTRFRPVFSRTQSHAPCMASVAACASPTRASCRACRAPLRTAAVFPNENPGADFRGRRIGDVAMWARAL